MPIPDPNIPFDARGRGVEPYDPHHFSANSMELAHMVPIVGPAEWPPLNAGGGVTPGARLNPLAGYAQPITSHPVRCLRDSLGGCDLAYHLAGVQVCDDGYARPVMRTTGGIPAPGNEVPVSVGESQILESGHASFLMAYGTPPTTLVAFSSDPGGGPR